MEDKPAQPPQPAATPQVGMDVVMPPKPQAQPVQTPPQPAPAPTTSAATTDQAATPVAAQPAPQPAPKTDAKATTPKQPKKPRTAPVGVIIIALLVMVALCTAAVMVYQKG